MSDDEISPTDQIRLARAVTTDPATRYDLDCNKIFLDGAATYPGFEHTIESLKEAGVANHDVILQCLDADNPAAILDYLGQDLDLAKQVAQMNPVRRASAIAAISRGEPIPSTRAQPAWRQSRGDIMNESISDREFSRLYDKKYGRNGMPGRGR